MGRDTRDDPLSDEELAEHWAAMVAAWRAALMDRDRRPGEGDWTWAGDEIGWVRRKEGGRHGASRDAGEFPV